MTIIKTEAGYTAYMRIGNCVLCGTGPTRWQALTCCLDAIAILREHRA